MRIKMYAEIIFNANKSKDTALFITQNHYTNLIYKRFSKFMWT